MATAPLFIDSLDTLKARLRLTGALQNDALAMIDAAIEKTRVRLVQALGVARVTTLLGIPYDAQALTDNGVLRIQANAVELASVRLELLRTLPTLFMDASGAKREAWNDEGFSRSTAKSDLKAELARLEQDVSAGIESLMGPTAGAAAVQISTIEPRCRPPVPGSSVFPRLWR